MTQVTETEIFAALKSVKFPDSDHNIVDANVASGLVVKDGHVQFALEIDPAMAEKMEPVRKQAEQGRLRRSRRSLGDGSAHSAQRSPAATAAGSATSTAAAQETAAAGRRYYRGRLRQGRGRQIDHFRKSGGRVPPDGLAHRDARCRYLWPIVTNHDGDFRPPVIPRRKNHYPNGSPRRDLYVHWLPCAAGHTHDLARPDGDGSARTDDGRRSVGAAGRPGGGYAAGHGRCAAHDGATCANRWRGDRLDAAGSLADRRQERPEHVSARSRCRSSAL